VHVAAAHILDHQAAGMHCLGVRLRGGLSAAVHKPGCLRWDTARYRGALPVVRIHHGAAAAVSIPAAGIPVAVNIPAVAAGSLRHCTVSGLAEAAHRTQAGRMAAEENALHTEPDPSDTVAGRRNAAAAGRMGRENGQEKDIDSAAEESGRSSYRTW